MIHNAATFTITGATVLPADGPHTVQTCAARAELGIDCQTVVVGRFADAPADDLSVGEFRVIAPCDRMASLTWDACDAYGIAWESCTVTAHH